jgi:hypothetical protein
MNNNQSQEVDTGMILAALTGRPHMNMKTVGMYSQNEQPKLSLQPNVGLLGLGSNQANMLY